MAVREYSRKAARGGINSFVGSIWHLAGAAEAVREQRSGNSGLERVGEAARGGISYFVGSIWHFSRSDRGCKRAAEAGIMAVRE